MRVKNESTMSGYEKFFFVALELLSFVHNSWQQSLMLDNQLVLLANDCYTRVSIGSKLQDSDIFFTTEVNGISDCEEECSMKRNACNSFSFGIGVKGNASCELSKTVPKAEELKVNRDYDVYIRSERSPHCESDRLYKIENVMKEERANETRPITRFGSGLLESIASNIYQPSRQNRISSNNRDYVSSIDEDRRTTDIVRNKNFGSKEKNWIGQNYSPFGLSDYEKLIVHSVESKDEEENNEERDIFGRQNFPRKNANPWKNGYFDALTFRRPIVHHSSNVNLQQKDLNNYEFLRNIEVMSAPIKIYNERDKINGDPGETSPWIEKNRHYTNFPSTLHNHKLVQNSTIQSYQNHRSRPFAIGGFTTDNYKSLKDEEVKQHGAQIHEKMKPCYRKLLSGKRSLQIHIKRAIECEKIEECHQACEYEKYFVCGGFNYKRFGPGWRGMCEMTSMSYPRIDVQRDFVSDSRCDYYERDLNCIPKSAQSYPPPSHSFKPDTRFASNYDPDRRHHGELPRPFTYNRRPFNDEDIPRPIDRDRRPQIHDKPYDSLYHGVYPLNQRPSATAESNGNGYSYGRPRYPRPNLYNNNDFYDTRFQHAKRPPFSSYPDRRMDYNDIGANEIDLYSPDYHKKDPREWTNYGGVYGGSYGYDAYRANHFDLPKYFPKYQPQQKPLRPQENDHFYGEFYNYGGAFGYGDNYIPADRDRLYGGTNRDGKCSVRAGAGFKLSRPVVRKTHLTPNFEHCESLCLNDKSFLCMTLAYRYNVAPTDPTDNCLLSEVSYKDLNFYTDIEPNRDYDIYAIIGDPKTCNAMVPSNRHPPDECFWRVRSGFGMPAEVVRKSILVNGLGDCQVECTISPEFTCRSFTFKYGLRNGQESTSANCFLSDWPSQEINPADMSDMDGAELYERGSFGRGCEPYPFPNFKFSNFANNQPPPGEEVCYSGYHRPCRLTPYSVLLSIRVDSETDCRQKCSKMRERDPIPCMSFSYKIAGNGRDENCLLSDVPIRDLRPGLDYAYDDDHVLYTWKDLDPQCMIDGYPMSNDRPFGGAVQGHGRPPLYGPPTDFHGPGIDIPDPRPFKPYGGSSDILPSYGSKPSIPYDPDRPDPVKPFYGLSHVYGNHNSEHGYTEHSSSGSFDYGPQESSTFQHYTVNGYPCRRGTKCEKNTVAGFWSCETEGSEYGNWDYCCEPQHHCGYSQGYHYPWCYVGTSEDQWRPCSEKYYPYLPSPRPVTPTIGDRRIHQDPVYSSRHWPITYLHKEPPPNCTDSLASADASRDDQKRNESSSTVPKVDSSSDLSSNAHQSLHTPDRRLKSRTAVFAYQPKTFTDVSNEKREIPLTFLQRKAVANYGSSADYSRNGKVEKILKLDINSTMDSALLQSTTIASPLMIAVPFKTKKRTIGSTRYRNFDKSNLMTRVPLFDLVNSSFLNPIKSF